MTHLLRQLTDGVRAALADRRRRWLLLGGAAVLLVWVALLARPARTASVAGRVTMPNGWQPTQLSIRVDGLDGPITKPVGIDADGRFSIDGLPTGPFTIRVLRPGGVQNPTRSGSPPASRRD